jgi:hypothetical protein
MFPDKDYVMKLLSAALLLAIVGVASPAVAQQEMQRGRDSRQEGRHGRMQQFLPGQNEPKISRDSMGQRSPSDAPMVQPVTEQRTEPGQAPSRERLTPEERRQLRRDINAAGRDIYRQTRSE